MKSTLLAIVITMFVSALYAVQNLDVVKIRFMFGEWAFPQGVWDIVLFCAGAALMWLVSTFAGYEKRGEYKKQINELSCKLQSAEAEKNNLIASIAALKNKINDDTQIKDSLQDDTILTASFENVDHGENREQ